MKIFHRLPAYEGLTRSRDVIGLSSVGLGTRQAVLDAFVPFISSFEGVVTFMYLDSVGKVTTGIGNLIDPVEAALNLPWRRPDGSLASQQEIRDNWDLIKSHQEMKLGGGGAYGNIPGNNLRLDDQGLDTLVQQRFRQNEQVLASRYPGYSSFPADAQLALHSWAWAVGPAARFPAFSAALNSNPPDFRTAANEVHVSGGAPARNDANRQLLEAAADVQAGGGSPDEIHVAVPGASRVLRGRLTPVAQRNVNVALALAAVAGAGYLAWQYQDQILPALGLGGRRRRLPA